MPCAEFDRSLSLPDLSLLPLSFVLWSPRGVDDPPVIGLTATASTRPVDFAIPVTALPVEVTVVVTMPVTAFPVLFAVFPTFLAPPTTGAVTMVPAFTTPPATLVATPVTALELPCTPDTNNFPVAVVIPVPTRMDLRVAPPTAPTTTPPTPNTSTRLSATPVVSTAPVNKSRVNVHPVDLSESARSFLTLSTSSVAPAICSMLYPDDSSIFALRRTEINNFLVAGLRWDERQYS
mmetsp:Transcript_23045/g.65323  ORF Transcript_23045/g.65323 Transcript_23045/m.65323 type:complete len:235 (-) Transcript_23045:12-716(-)